MKTEYKTEDELIFLRNVLTKAYASTENLIFFDDIEEIDNYRLILIKFRKECFDCLGESDPNQIIINKIEKNILKRKSINL
jgi:hypothetical protein